MDLIHGSPLSELGLEKWPAPVQLRTVHHLRHAIRALRYGGVLQSDWHLGQILMKKAPSESASFDTALDETLVLVDFAFTNLRLGHVMDDGDSIVAKPFNKYDNLAQVLQASVSPSVRDDSDTGTWFSYDDFEL